MPTACLGYLAIIFQSPDFSESSESNLVLVRLFETLAWVIPVWTLVWTVVASCRILVQSKGLFKSFWKPSWFPESFIDYLNIPKAPKTGNVLKLCSTLIWNKTLPELGLFIALVYPTWCYVYVWCFCLMTECCCGLIGTALVEQPELQSTSVISDKEGLDLYICCVCSTDWAQRPWFGGLHEGLHPRACLRTSPVPMCPRTHKDLLSKCIM
jgi:hypothetical protein